MFCLSINETPIRVLLTMAAGQLTLLMRQPTFGELMADDQLCTRAFSGNDDNGEAYARLILSRINLVTGWEDVVNAVQQPVPFTRKNLELLLAHHRDAAAPFIKATADLMRGVDPGESAGTSATASKDVPAASTSTTSPTS